MKTKKPVYVIAAGILIALIAAVLIPTIGSVRITTVKGKTLAQMSNYANAIEMFRMEYGHYPQFRSTRELAEILEKTNEKRISFHSFSEYERNGNGDIVDYYENELIVSMSGENLVLISPGKDGLFDSVDYIDDIVLHHPLKNAQPVDGEQ